MRRSLVGLGLAAAIAFVLGSPASAAPGRNDEVSFGGTTRALRSPRANALTDDNLGGAAFGYARELIVLGPDLAVWAEAGAAIDAARGAMFQIMHSRIGAFDLTGGLRVRYGLHRRITASARVAGGAQRTSVEISGNGVLAKDTTWGALVSTALAVDVLAVATPGFGFGVRAELGYVRAQARAVTLHDDAGSAAIPLPRMDAELGRLDLSGPTLGISLVGQF
jgi:hypothetical protein